MPELIRDEEGLSYHEIRKTGLISSLYCILLLFRTYQILSSYHYYQGSLLLEEWIFSGLYSGLILLMLFRNYWIVPLLIAMLQAKFDGYFGCHTVGSNITVFINFYFAAFYFALKNFRKDKNHTKFNGLVFNYKYLLACTWAILNLYSLVNHLKDAHWINGTAFGVMFCNPYLSPFYQTFRHLYLNYHEGYLLVTKMMSYGFIVLQFLMLTFLMIRKARILYYLFFFSYLIGITFIIDTSFLAHFAWLLFFLLLPQTVFKDRKIFVQKNPLKLSHDARLLNRGYAIVIGLFVLLNTPKLDTSFRKVVWLFREWDTYKLVDRKLAMIGLTKVNLFNTYQIDGGNKWFVIYKKENSNWQLVPLMDTNGRKLSYNSDWLHTTNHGSDFLFLANTFQYATGQERVDYSNSVTPYKTPGPVYERLIRFDFNKYNNSPLQDYKICFYSTLKAKGSSNPFRADLDSISLYICSEKALHKKLQE